MKKRHFVFLLLFLCATKSICQAQLFDRSRQTIGWYPTDTTERFRPCNKDWGVYQYFSLHKKYPESSMMLLKKVRSIYQKPENCTQSGFITFRFIVNCRSETGWYHTYEIDERYQARTFDPKIASQLLTFVQSLTDWPVGMVEGEAVDYFTYFTFKIKHGEIDNLVP
ncbi:hypothetical protein [Larkinella punicea]|uniref:TonB C-terminal domain-containing protein n=1 Tax=Larkinella punicea TaxID=2315727 RepID=A0A368JQB0_9BACT|nr:hypothetical protein [Larkinella punicea]RCR68773.1 hypothetical protein DUE52_14930 [Larkinella punicea]